MPSFDDRKSREQRPGWDQIDAGEIAGEGGSPKADGNTDKNRPWELDWNAATLTDAERTPDDPLRDIADQYERIELSDQELSLADQMDHQQMALEELQRMEERHLDADREVAREQEQQRRAELRIEPDVDIDR